MAHDLVEGTEPPSPGGDVIERQIAGLDALEMAARSRRGFLRRAWASTWPVVAAIAIAIGVWELVVLSGWKPTYVLPGPGDVFPQLGKDLSDGAFWSGLGLTMRRAVIGFALAAVTMFSKALTGYLATKNWRAGAVLTSRGEFSIVIAGLGAVMEPELGPVAAAYVLITAIIGPILARFI